MQNHASRARLDIGMHLSTVTDVMVWIKVMGLFETLGNPPSALMGGYYPWLQRLAAFCSFMMTAGELHPRNSPALARGGGRSRAKHARDDLAYILMRLDP